MRHYSIFIAAMLFSATAFAQASTTDMHVKVANNQTLVSSAVSQEPYTSPLPKIAEKDISWRRRLWRDIDVNDIANSKESNLANILMQEIEKGDIKGYSPKDNRFTMEMNADEMKVAKVLHTTKFQVKEDWLFIPKENKMVIRIVGIAPLDDKGNPVYWVFYPQAADYLAQYKLSSNDNSTKSWDELLFVAQNKG